MKKVLLTLAACVSFNSSFAGQQIADPVIISANSFQGGLGYARNTSDSLQYIGCFDFGSSISCTARNSDGVTRRCFSATQTDIDIVRSLSNGGHLFANIDNFGGCRLVGRHSSQDAPK